MQAPMYVDRDYAIAQWPNDFVQVADSFVVGSSRTSHVERLTDRHHVAAVQSRGFAEIFQRTIFRERLRKAFRFASARDGSQTRDDRDLLEYDDRILHENAVRLIVKGGQGHDPSS